jgi:hypothetical protein
MRVLLALALVTGVAAADGWRDYTGKPCPTLTARVWFNTAPGKAPTNASLKGKVWVLWFFGDT